MLEGRDLVLRYTEGAETVKAVDGVSVTVQPREFVGILGASGSGKSSLLYLLSGLKRPSAGEVLFEDRSLGSLDATRLARLRRQHFGFVFQRHFLIGYLTGRENVRTGGPGDADALLSDLGIAHCARKYPHQMSGGSGSGWPWPGR